MALKRHRSLAALTFLAAYPLAIFVATAGAEDRKFVVFLADPSKDHLNGTLVLPKRTDIWDAYFDKVKNGQDGNIRIDSFAEWWEEVSYGDVTVSANDQSGIVSLPVAGSGAGLVSGAGVVSANMISNTITSYIDASTVDTEGGLDVAGGAWAADPDGAGRGPGPDGPEHRGAAGDYE